jgi:hypothetical protein
MWALLRPDYPQLCPQLVRNRPRGQGQRKRIAIAKILVVSNSIASVSRVESTAKIAIAMDAATTLKMSQSERKPSRKCSSVTRMPSDQRSPQLRCPQLHPLELDQGQQASVTL